MLRERGRGRARDKGQRERGRERSALFSDRVRDPHPSPKRADRHGLGGLLLPVSRGSWREPELWRGGS
jgi:hypothetical protein